MILSPGGHQNYAGAADAGPSGVHRGATMRTARGTGRQLPIFSNGSRRTSINNSEDGQPDDDPLHGVRAHVAPADAYRRDRVKFLHRIREAEMRQANDINNARLDRRERRRQQAIEEGLEWNEDDEEELLVPVPSDDWLTIPEHIARREYESYMSTIYQVNLLNLFKSENDESGKVRSFTTM
jgi:hypothetical protein